MGFRLCKGVTTAKWAEAQFCSKCESSSYQKGGCDRRFIYHIRDKIHNEGSRKSKSDLGHEHTRIGVKNWIMS